jgi:uncharacterized repeat protein (TIGR03803 family)
VLNLSVGLRNSLAVCVLALVVAVPAASAPAGAYKFSVVVGFTGSANGGPPASGLIRDGANNLYGTTSNGGYGWGVVYKVTPGGTQTVLHAFGAKPDGEDPQSDLTMDAQGNLYGTTDTGGTYNQGTVYKIASDGTESVLYSFAGAPNDGANPQGGVVLDAKDNIYGTTSAGGTHYVGTIFKLKPDGTEKVLHNFAGLTNDGALPEADLIADSSGVLYGTTVNGGPGNFGTIFEVGPTGKEKILFFFHNVADGAFPHSGLINDSKGNFYGTVANGGPNGSGAVFHLTKSGDLNVIYRFTSGNDGGAVWGGVILDAKGDLYGTTAAGGFYNYGTAYKLTPSGKLTVLYAFADASDGGSPYNGLVEDTLGNFYSTTAYGGPNGRGDVFKLTAK